MTGILPVVLPDAPFERPEPRVTVTRHPGVLNAGDGTGTRFVLRYVVETQQSVWMDAPDRETAAHRAATLVREREPQAVWLLDADRTAGSPCAVAGAWRPLARAARDVQAAFVAWHGPG